MRNSDDDDDENICPCQKFKYFEVGMTAPLASEEDLTLLPLEVLGNKKFPRHFSSNNFNMANNSSSKPTSSTVPLIKKYSFLLSRRLSWRKKATDRFKLIYLTIILHGIGTQMSWHMFISTKDYFSTYKLGNELKMPDNNSVYATRFLQYISFSSQIPNLLFNWINIFLNINANYTSRIVWSILIEVIVFVLTIILAMVDSSNWPGVFFYLTIGSNILLNSANGIYHSTVYGLAAKLPFEYSGAVVIGSSISGIIMAIINLISITLTPNSRTAAIYYFITALFLLLACFDTYFALPLNKFFRYYDYNYNKALVSKRKVNVQGLEGQSSSPIPYWKIFQGCSLQCFNIFFTFMITFTVFPSMMSNIQRSYSHFFIGDYYYSAITCFLTYNIAALFGNIIAGITNFFKPKWLIIPVILRAFFILFFAFCNYKPIGVERIWPVLFHWDEMYWTVGMFFGLSGGYLSALSLMYCPRTVEAEYAATAAMFGAASILSGIMGGIALSSMMPILVSSQELAFELPNWWPPFNPIP